MASLQITTRPTTKGFTIVELLIVIVVIGILAAITIVAYNGVTARANNSQQLTALTNYVKIISSYAVLNNGFPSGSNTYMCLGAPSGTPNCGSTNTGVNACGYGAAPTDSVINTKLQTVSGSLPFYGSLTATCANSTARGIIYYYASSTYATLIFWVNDTSCPAISGTVLVNKNTEGASSSCQIQLLVTP
jgi:prepilin-type N-terminal cleavage/methylation domain-containing protein